MSRDILLSQIDPDPNQPRKHFDQASIEELAQSMQANGLAVPVLVRPFCHGSWWINNDAGVLTIRQHLEIMLAEEVTGHAY